MANFDNLTLDEVETIENLVGVSIDEMLNKGELRGKPLKVMAWILTKRTNPDYKIEDAGKLSLKDAFDIVNGDDEKKVQ
jgi:hypothetical protein